MSYYSQSLKIVLLAMGLLAAVLFCLAARRSRLPSRKTVLLGLSPVLLLVLAGFAIPDRILEQSAPGRLLIQHRNEIHPDTLLIADRESVNAVCWQFKRDDVYLLISGGELDYGLSYADAAGRRLDVRSASRLIRENRGRVVLVARGKIIHPWRRQLPAPAARFTNGREGYVLWKY